MKKTLKILSMLLTVFALIILSSCNNAGGDTDPEPEELTADSLFELIDEKMDSYDSYKSEMTISMKMTVGGVELKLEADGVDIRSGLKSDAFEFYTKVDTTISTSATDKQTSTTTKAYSDGNYFISNKGNGTEQKLYSRMSDEEALEYSEGDSAELFEFGDCVNKEFKKNDDGTYELTFSGYTAKAINGILESTGIDRDMISAEIVDVVFGIKATSDFSATELSLDFEFEQTEGKSLPQITFKGTYSSFNEAVIDSSTLNIEKYTEIDDVRLLDELEELIADRAEAESGEFKLTVSQSVKVMGNSQSSTETDNVVFGINEGGYFYDIDADMNGTKYDISYSNGKQSVTSEGKTNQNTQTEQDARAFIESLINSGQYNKLLVTGLTKVSESEIRVTCEPKAAYETVFETMGAKYRSASQTISFIIEGGRLMEINSEVAAKGYFTQGNSTYEISLTVGSKVEIVK